MPTLSLEALNGGPNSALVYTSGMPAAFGQVICSAADFELYRRKTASIGNITVDPADAPITDYNAVSYDRIAAIAIPTLYGGAANSGVWGANFPKTTLPVINAGVRTSLISATGRGHLRVLAYYHNGPSQNVRFEIIIDGKTVLDNTYAGLPAANGLLFVGEPTGAGNNAYTNFSSSGVKISFKRSLQVYMTPIGSNTNASAIFQGVLQSEA